METSILDSKNGIYDVFYQVPVRGVFDIHISYNGNRIPCKFSITILSCKI